MSVKINTNKLMSAINLITKTIKNKNYISVCGTWGSAAIVDHYVCNYFEQLSKYSSYKAKIKSLNSDSYLLSAISFSKIFKIQWERYYQKGDILILISSSGNSSNIKNVLRYCKRNKIKTIGFTNFEAVYLKKYCDININTEVKNYGIA